MNGRLNYTLYLTKEQVDLIILLNKHKLKELLLEYYHKKFHRHGMDTVANQATPKYWITHVENAVVKNIFRKSLLCKNRKSRDESFANLKSYWPFSIIYVLRY